MSFSAARCLDRPLFLLPNIWLCSQHPGRCQHRGLPKHRTGLPAAAGKDPQFSDDSGVLPPRNTPAAYWLLFIVAVQPENFPYKEEISALSTVCLVLIVLLFIGCILGFKVTSPQVTETEPLPLSGLSKYCVENHVIHSHPHQSPLP